MYIYNREDILKIEQITCLEQDIDHIGLITRAADAFSDIFMTKVYKKPLPVYIFAGNGNNGSDAIAIANNLSSRIEDISLYLVPVSPTNSREYDYFKNQIHKSINVYNIDNKSFGSLNIPNEGYMIDGLLGSGISRAPEGILAELIAKINVSRAYKVAIDIPTGLSADGMMYSPAVMSDETIGLGTHKLGYYLYQTEDAIGKLHLANIGLEVKDRTADGSIIDKERVRKILHDIRKQTHKYLQGSVLLIGGQYGMVGCMRLAGEAALRSGCGLVTLHVPKCAVEFLQGSLPEALIEPDENFYSVGLTQDYKKFNTIAIGPGMGLHTKQFDLIRRLLYQKPPCKMVWDADALKILGKDPALLKQVPPGSIFTPHRGEFAYLFGQKLTGIDFHEFALEKAVQHKVILVVKGPDTVIYFPDGSYAVNTSGNCGMATAGSGDVLTGIISGILAQGYTPEEAALVGVYLHGLAGDIAADRLGHHSLIASDIIQHTGHAFKSLDD